VKKSEYDFQPELNLSRIPAALRRRSSGRRGQNFPGVCRWVFRTHNTTSYSAGRRRRARKYASVRLSKVGVVQNIEKLGAELYLSSLAQPLHRRVKGILKQ
jgi:hypothetical protein